MQKIDDQSLSNKHITQLEQMLKKEVAESKQKTLIKIIEDRHKMTFGVANKSLALKIKDLKTQDIIDKFKLSPKTIERYRLNAKVFSYFNYAPLTIAWKYTTPLQVLQSFERIQPLMMKYWDQMFKSIEEANDVLSSYRDKLTEIVRDNDVTKDDIETLSSIVGDYELKSLKKSPFKYIHTYINNIVRVLENGYFNADVQTKLQRQIDSQYASLHYHNLLPKKDIAESMLELGLINKSEASLLKSLFSYLHYKLLAKQTDNVAGLNTSSMHVTRGKCMYYQNEYELNGIEKELQSLIHLMEAECKVLNTASNEKKEKIREIILHISTLPDELTDTTFSRIMNEIETSINKSKDEIHKEEKRYGYEKSLLDLDNLHLTFKIGDQLGYDLGGVTRMVLYKLAEYLSKKLKKDAEGLYHLCKPDGNPLSSAFIADVLLFFKIVTTTDTKVDLPLSYGIIYMLTNPDLKYAIERKKTDIEIKGKYSISLETLMALYHMQDPDELKNLIKMLAMSDDQIAEYLPDYPQSSQVPQGSEYNYATKLAWLHTVLYKKLFYPFSKKIPVLHLHKIMRGRIYKRPNGNRVLSQDDNFKMGISELASYFQIPLNIDVMKSIPIIPENEENPNIRTIYRNIEYLKRFIIDNPTKWESMLVFIHGSLRTEKEIKVNYTGAGFPSSHTCFGILDLKPYQRYEDFSKEFTFAIDNTSGLHLI